MRSKNVDRLLAVLVSLSLVFGPLPAHATGEATETGAPEDTDAMAVFGEEGEAAVPGEDDDPAPEAGGQSSWGDDEGLSTLQTMKVEPEGLPQQTGSEGPTQTHAVAACAGQAGSTPIPSESEPEGLPLQTSSEDPTQTYAVSVSANPAEGGTVTGGGNYASSATATVTATANSGYVFAAWYDGGELVSSEATYSFTPTGDRNLVTRFRKSTKITVSYWDGQPFTASRGDRLLIQGRLQDAQGNMIGGRELTLSLEGKTYTDITRNYSHSLGSYSFYVYPLQEGAGTFEISFAGDETYSPTSVQCNIDVKPKTLSELVIDPVEPIEPDGQVTISGRLLDEDGKGIGGAEISMDSFEIRGQNGNIFHLPDAQTDAGGSFSTTGYWEGGSDLFLLGGTIDISLTYRSNVYSDKSAYVEIPVVNPAIAVSAKMVWDDVDDADGVRPDSVWLTLRRADGRPVVDSDGHPVAATEELSGDAGAGVGVAWDNLPKYHEEYRKTTPITYEIVQTDASGQAWTPQGYTNVASGNMKDGFTFTNTHPHTHQLEAVAEVEPTCTTAGAQAHWTCTSCHRLFSDEGGTTRISAPTEIPALGHDWGAWTVTKAATCTAEGTETRTCKHDATHVETRELPIDPDAHDWGAWTVAKAATCTDRGIETRTCTHDATHAETRDVAVDPDAHGWGEWVVTKAATETEEGTETRICRHDSTHAETRTIPKLDPKAATYRSTKGDGGIWTKGNTTTLDFSFKRTTDDEATFDHFVGIRVDGKLVDAKHYTAEPGSVIVALKATYLETLAVGSHTLEALFDDGDAVSASFRIAAKEERPSTPDGEKDQAPGNDTDGSNKGNEGNSAKDDKTRGGNDGKDDATGGKDDGTGGKDNGSKNGNDGNAGGDTGSNAGEKADNRASGTDPATGNGSTGTQGSATNSTASIASTTGTAGHTSSTAGTSTKSTTPSTGDHPLPWPSLMLLAGAGLLLAGIARRRMRDR